MIDTETCPRSLTRPAQRGHLPPPVWKLERRDVHSQFAKELSRRKFQTQSGRFRTPLKSEWALPQTLTEGDFLPAWTTPDCPDRCLDSEYSSDHSFGAPVVFGFRPNGPFVRIAWPSGSGPRTAPTDLELVEPRSGNQNATRNRTLAPVGFMPEGPGLATTRVSKPAFHRHEAGGDETNGKPHVLVAKPAVHRRKAGGAAQFSTLEPSAIPALKRGVIF